MLLDEEDGEYSATLPQAHLNFPGYTAPSKGVTERNVEAESSGSSTSSLVQDAADGPAKNLQIPRARSNTLGPEVIAKPLQPRSSAVVEPVLKPNVTAAGPGISLARPASPHRVSSNETATSVYSEQSDAPISSSTGPTTTTVSPVLGSNVVSIYSSNEQPVRQLEGGAIDFRKPDTSKQFPGVGGISGTNTTTSAVVSTDTPSQVHSNQSAKTLPATLSKPHTDRNKHQDERSDTEDPSSDLIQKTAFPLGRWRAWTASRLSNESLSKSSQQYTAPVSGDTDFPAVYPPYSSTTDRPKPISTSESGFGSATAQGTTNKESQALQELPKPSEPVISATGEDVVATIFGPLQGSKPIFEEVLRQGQRDGFYGSSEQSSKANGERVTSLDAFVPRTEEPIMQPMSRVSRIVEEDEDILPDTMYTIGHSAVTGGASRVVSDSSSVYTTTNGQTMSEKLSTSDLQRQTSPLNWPTLTPYASETSQQTPLRHDKDESVTVKDFYKPDPNPRLTSSPSLSRLIVNRHMNHGSQGYGLTTGSHSGVNKTLQPPTSRSNVHQPPALAQRPYAPQYSTRPYNSDYYGTSRGLSNVAITKITEEPSPPASEDGKDDDNDTNENTENTDPDHSQAPDPYLSQDEQYTPTYTPSITTLDAPRLLSMKRVSFSASSDPPSRSASESNPTSLSSASTTKRIPVPASAYLSIPNNNSVTNFSRPGSSLSTRPTTPSYTSVPPTTSTTTANATPTTSRRKEPRAGFGFAKFMNKLGGGDMPVRQRDLRIHATAAAAQQRRQWMIQQQLLEEEEGEEGARMLEDGEFEVCAAPVIGY